MLQPHPVCSHPGGAEAGSRVGRKRLYFNFLPLLSLQCLESLDVACAGELDVPR